MRNDPASSTGPPSGAHTVRSGQGATPRDRGTLVWLYGEAPLARTGLVGVVLLAVLAAGLAGLVLNVLGLPPVAVFALAIVGIALTWLAEVVHAGSGPVAAGLRLLGLPAAAIGGFALTTWLTDAVSGGGALAVAVGVTVAAGALGEALRAGLAQRWGRLTAERVMVGPALMVGAMFLMTIGATSGGMS